MTAENFNAAELRQAMHRVRTEVDKAMGELRTGVAELTVEATRKVLGNALDEATQQKLVDQAVEQLDFERLRPQHVGAGS